MTQERLRVWNLDCRACEQRLDHALRALPGVEAAESSCLTETVTVRYDAARVSPEELRRCIRRAGCALPGDGTPPAPRRTALLRSFFLALLLTLPLLWALPVWMQLGFVLAQLLVSGREAVKKPWRADTLTLLAVGLLWGVGVWRVCAGLPGRLWLILGSAALTALLFGRWLEAALQYRALEPVRRLLRLQPRTAMTAAGERDVDDLRPGDLALLRAGERIPADGTLAEGMLTVDERDLTDAVGLTEKRPGDALLAGTLIRAGDGQLSVSAVGEATALRQKAARLQGGRNRHAD